jgi:hypothetical protein
MVKDADHGEKGSGARVEHGMSGWVLVSSWFEMGYRIQGEIKRVTNA